MSFLVSVLRRVKNWYSWISFGKFVFVITTKAIAQLVIAIGGLELVRIAWYTCMGFIICFLACMWIFYDFYLQYKMKRIPFMDCIQSIEQYLTKNNKNITVLGDLDVLDAVHFARESPYSRNTKKIILHVLEACKNGKITLFGQQGVLTDINIDPHHIDKEKIIFTEGLPELHNGFNKIIYNNLTIEKNEAMKWAMKELLPSITHSS